MDMLVSVVSVKLSVSGNGKVLLRETVFAAARTSSVRPLLLSFQGNSPSQKAKFIGAFTLCHHLGKVGIQSGTDFFEPDCVRSQVSLRTNGMKLQTLKNTNQAAHVQIPDVNLCEGITFGHFRTIFCRRGLLFGFLRSMIVSEERSECWLDTQIAERLRVPRQGAISVLFSAKEGVPQPAQVEKEPGNWDAWKVAHKVGNA